MDTRKQELELGSGAVLPERKDIPGAYVWALSDIYASEDSWEKDFSAVREEILSLTEYSGRLGESAEVLLEFFTKRDELSIILEKLYVYAHMKSHEDTAESKYQGPANRISTLGMEFGAALSFVTPELLSLPEGALEAYIASPVLKDYAFGLKEVLRQRAHVLSKDAEEIVAKTADMAGIADNAFSMLTNADMKFGTIEDENGNSVELSEERATTYLRSENREVRKAAFKALYKPYEEMKNTLGATFDGMLKASKFYSEVRKYDSPLASALDSNNVPEEIYSSLVDTLESNLEPMHRYMALRKKMLGLDELHMYDIYAPLVSDPYKDISWTEAKEMMYEALAPLGEKYIEQVKKGIASGWVDVFANKGKRSGAYSWGSYATHPYIFMNYTNTLNDVSTLVHEMGHSMHSFYSRENQPYPTADYCIFTAEVASTTNEVLLLTHLINNTEDKQKKLYLLNRRLENIRTTVYRQTMFASFEREVHRRCACGEDTTPDGLKQLWYDLNRRYYGDEIIIDDELKMEWARIPHFYSPFYVYQYATGYSAATALASNILTKGEEGRDRYLNFLTKGGSDFPVELLKGAGVDMSTPQPVEEIVRIFTETLDEIEKLTD